MVRGLQCESVRKMLRGMDAAEGGLCLPREGETARGAVCPNIGGSGSVLGHRDCNREARKDCVRESFGEDGGEFRVDSERLERWSQRRCLVGAGDSDSRSIVEQEGVASNDSFAFSRLIVEDEGVASNGSSGIRLEDGDGGTSYSGYSEMG